MNSVIWAKLPITVLVFRGVGDWPMFPLPKLWSSAWESRRAFGCQNRSLWDTCWRLWTIGSKPSIFEGYTVRFARFCNTRLLVFASQNTLKKGFFTYLTESRSETRKEGPTTLRKGSQNSPLEPPEALRKRSRNWTPRKVTFCAGH